MESLLAMIVFIVIVFAFWGTISKFTEWSSHSAANLANKAAEGNIDQSNKVYNKIVKKYGEDFMTATEIHEKIYKRDGSSTSNKSVTVGG